MSSSGVVKAERVHYRKALDSLTLSHQEPHSGTFLPAAHQENDTLKSEFQEKDEATESGGSTEEVEEFRFRQDEESVTI